MVRILHTADLHLDRPFKQLGPRGKERRRGLRRLFERICSAAKERSDILLIVGDLFEHDYVASDTVNFIKNQLATIAPLPVFIAPGNHDPCVSDSPYLTETWPDNVRIFTRNSFVDIDLPEHNLCVHGIANTSFQDSTRYLQNYKVPSDGRLHVVLFHGSDIHAIPPHQEQEIWFPFNEQDLRNCGAHYVALGHYHSSKQYFRESAGEAQSPIAYYPGCPESLDFGDVGDKSVALVEVSEKGNRLETIPMFGYWHEQMDLDCQGMSSREDIINKLRDLATERNWQNAVVRVVLRGEVDPGLELHQDEISTSLADGIFFLDINDQTEFPYDMEELEDRRDALGEFTRKVRLKLEQNSTNEYERRKLQLALLLGIDAFLRNEVRGL